jgi:hypothetical protein
MLASSFGHETHKTVAITAEVIISLLHFWQIMRSGSEENLSGHSGGVGGLGEVGGGCARAAGADIGSVCDVNGFVGMKKLTGKEAGEGCSGVVHGARAVAVEMMEMVLLKVEAV